MAATSKATPAKKTTPSPAEKKADVDDAAEKRDRKVHLLIRRDPADKKVVAIESFSGELAARRELDDRPEEWKYLGLVPGDPFTVEVVPS